MLASLLACTHTIVKAAKFAKAQTSKGKPKGKQPVGQLSEAPRKRQPSAKTSKAACTTKNLSGYAAKTACVWVGGDGVGRGGSI